MSPCALLQRDKIFSGGEAKQRAFQVSQARRKTPDPTVGDSDGATVRQQKRDILQQQSIPTRVATLPVSQRVDFILFRAGDYPRCWPSLSCRMLVNGIDLCVSVISTQAFLTHHHQRKTRRQARRKIRTRPGKTQRKRLADIFPVLSWKIPKQHCDSVLSGPGAGCDIPPFSAAYARHCKPGPRTGAWSSEDKVESTGFVHVGPRHLA